MQSNTQILKQCSTPDMWTSLVEDFRVRTLALREKWKEYLAKEVDCGPKILELYGKLDQSTQSLKTAQLCLFEDLSESYSTFPKSGIMLNGNVYLTTLLDIPIRGKGSMLLPTPTKSDYKATFAQVEALTRYLKSGHQIRMMDILCQKGFTKYQRVALFEMVMGFDIGHTELGP